MLKMKVAVPNAEALYKELLSKIQDLEDTMQRSVQFELEKVMDVQRAKLEIKVQRAAGVVSIFFHLNVLSQF
jgi:hypothetical protein